MKKTLFKQTEYLLDADMTDHYCAVEGPSFPHVLSFIHMCCLVAGASSHPALLLTPSQSRIYALYHNFLQL